MTKGVINATRLGALRRAMPPAYVTMAGLVAGVLLLAALFAPQIAPTNPLDLRSFNLADSEIPPFWVEGGDARFLLGTDNQGRDMLSAILYGARVSIMIGGGAVFLAAAIGVSLGLLAGYLGGRIDAVIMRIGDVILSFPTILLALLVAGLARAITPEVFVAIGICTHLGCSPSDAPKGGNNPSLPADWPGGFFCPCHGSTFDGAGRVFKNKPAPTNLEIPPHRYAGETRILIGDDAAA